MIFNFCLNNFNRYHTCTHLYCFFPLQSQFFFQFDISILAKMTVVNFSSHHNKRHPVRFHCYFISNVKLLPIDSFICYINFYTIQVNLILNCIKVTDMGVNWYSKLYSAISCHGLNYLKKKYSHEFCL